MTRKPKAIVCEDGTVADYAAAYRELCELAPRLALAELLTIVNAMRQLAERPPGKNLQLLISRVDYAAKGPRP